MQRNQLYLIIGVLAVVAIGLGIYAMREQSRPDGIEIKVNENGVSVQQN